MYFLRTKSYLAGIFIWHSGIQPLISKIKQFWTWKLERILNMHVLSWWWYITKQNSFPIYQNYVRKSFQKWARKGKQYCKVKRSSSAFWENWKKIISENAHFDPKLNTRDKCDASGNGLGGVLEEQTHTVWKLFSYASRYLNACKQIKVYTS